MTPDQRPSQDILDRFKICRGDIPLLKFHVARTFEAFSFLGISIAPERLAKIYLDVAKQCPQDEMSARIVFSVTAPLQYHVDYIPIEPISEPVILRPTIVPKDFPLSRFKFNNRESWNALLAQLSPDADDVLLVDEENQIIESSRYNIFWYDRENSRYLTPPLAQGCLQGVFRSSVLESPLPGGPVKEGHVNLEQARSGDLFVGNSVRGFLRAQIKTK